MWGKERRLLELYPGFASSILSKRGLGMPGDGADGRPERWKGLPAGGVSCLGDSGVG